MPAVLDAAKQGTKQEEFVEKQIEHARRRIRTLDFFSVGLFLLIGSLAFLLTILVVDRYVETPAGIGWAALGLYVLGAAGFVYLTLFRPSRRQINPFYAAHQVEQTIEGAKNSVVNYVDLKDDEKIPGSVKASIGARAAKDLKQVDLNRVIQKKQILWLAALAGVFFVASVVVAFLPPTRTSMTLTEPKEGDITINQGEDFRVEVELKGRIPKKTDPDVARLRMWYNPEDPNTYEERPLEPIEGRQNAFGLTVPAKQLRNGFHYKLLAAKAHTRDFEVKVRIVPQFTGWDVSYVYPEYLKREPEKSGDPNLVGYYNTIVTVTAYTNKPVKSGTVLIAGEVNTFTGTLLPDNPEAIRFQFPMTRHSTYKIIFATTDGDSNRSREREPQTYRMSLIDPKPLFLNYEVTYDYPKYLRFQPATVRVRQPHLGAMRGTKVTLVAHANRPVKSAQVQFPGHDQPIAGTIDDKKPMEVRFTLPAMMQDGAYRLSFAPKTNESESAAEVFNVRILSDEKPKVEITKPEQLEIELPANGILPVEGIATDDIGIAKLNLRMELVSPAPSKPLAPKPYRDGKSFQRPEDNSFPTRIDYKDFVDLAKVKPDGAAGAGFQLQEGMVVQYWLEAIDNCDVPPGPNTGESGKKRVKILAPVKKMPEQQKQEQQNLEKDKKEHEKKQDQKNAEEKRDPNQPQPKGDPQDQPEQGEKGKEPPRGEQKGDPKVGKKSDKTGMEGMGEPMPPMEGEEPMVDPMEEAKVKDALAQANKKKGGTDTDPKDPKPQMKDDPKEPKKANPEKDPKVDPKEPKVNPDNPKEPKKENPTEQPKKGADKLDPKQLPKPEDFQDLADKLDDPKKKEEGREQLKQLMEQAKKNPDKAEDAQKKAEDFRDKLPKDEQKKFDESLDKIAKEMENIQRQDQKDQVKKAAEKAMSNDPKERAEGQKQLEDMMRDPKKKEDVDRELQNLASDQTDGVRKQRLDDAMNLSKNNLAKKDRNPNTDPPPPMPKKDEDVDELAKKVQKGTPEEKKEAEDELQKKLKDPDQREKVQQQLDDFKKNIKDEQAKKNFEESMNKIKENLAKKDEAKPTAEDVQKLADKLNSKDEKERQEARQQLEKSIDKSDKDPKAQQEARKQMEDLRDGIKDEKKKEDFDKAMKQIDQASDEIRQEKQAKAEKQMKEDVGKVAKDLNGKDPMKKEAAEQKLEEMLKDPKKKDAVKNELDKIKEESKDELAKKNIDDAVKKAEDKLAKKEPAPKGGRIDPKDVEKIAKDLNGKDPMKKDDAQQKLEDLLKDPAKKDAVKDELEKIKKGLNDETAKKNIDDAVKKAEDKIAKAGMGDQPKKEDVEKLARDLNSKDQKTKDAAEEKLEEMLKDPNQRGIVKNELDKIKKGLDDETAKKNIDDAIKKAEEKIAKGKEGNAKPEDIAKMADKLQNGNPGEKQQAQKQLEEMLKDPKARDQVEKELDKIKDGLKDQTAKDNLDKAVKQAKDNIAKKDEAPKVKPEDVEKLVKDLQSDDPKAVEKARKEIEEIAKDSKKKADFDKQLGEMLKDPEKRKQFQEAIEQPVKNEIKKIADKLQNGKPEEKKQAREKLEEMLKNPLDGEVLKQNLGDYVKEIKDPKARDELEKQVKEIEQKLQAKKDLEAKDPGKKVDLTKHDPKKSGNQTSDPEKEGPLAELKNKVKAGELLLNEFKKNITNEELKKQLGYTDEQMAAFRKRYEQQLAALQKQLEMAEKGELPLPRLKGASPIGRDGPEKINLDPRESGNPLQGGRTIAPPGFGDPYKRFAEEVSGVRTPMPPAAKK